MSDLILPKTPSGRAAAEILDRRRAERAAANIANSSKTALASDEFLSDRDVWKQFTKLMDYETTLPRPVGWRLAFLILQPPEKTSGGLELPVDVTEAYAHKSMQGIVVAIGETAYKDKERFPEGPWVNVGDRIIFKRYDAQVYELANGQRIGIMNDTQPIAVIGEAWDWSGWEKTNG